MIKKPDITIEDNRVQLSGDIRLEDVPKIEKELASTINTLEDPDIELDVSGIDSIDSAGALFLNDVAKSALGTKKNIHVTGLKPELEERVIKTVNASESVKAKLPPPLERFEPLAIWLDEAIEGTKEVIILTADIFYWSIRDIFRRAQMRQGTFIQQSYLIGSQAVPIIATILFLIGAVSALQSSAQLRQFGATIYVANLLAIGICRELGPLMTAIIVSGRSGSAIAAEVATMKFTEELDALKSMGLNPLRFVVVPKFWAMTISMPFLTLIANFMGILGGFLVGITMIKQVPSAFFHQIIESLIFYDIFTGLIKSVSFAWIITITGVYRGIKHHGGAEGVGLATTSSVVTAIFAIIAADSFWGIVFYYG